MSKQLIVLGGYRGAAQRSGTPLLNSPAALIFCGEEHLCNKEFDCEGSVL